MTPGQERATRELKRIQAADPDAFEVVEGPQEVDGRLVAKVSLRIGPIETREGGLELRDREQFVLSVPPDFPFDYPTLLLDHDRFAHFPHVIWSSWICLYQSHVEWNPADGLYGFFDRLSVWLGRAATNEMDPVEGPLEPPHHVIDASQPSFVIRKDAPVPAGERWLGLAEIETHANRFELIGWNNLTGPWPTGRRPALAIFLPKPLPMEFPKQGSDFFKELTRQELDRDQILRYLAIAAYLTPKGEPLHMVLGIPMRRASDGSLRSHIAVWTLDADSTNSLRVTLPQDTDTDELRTLRRELADALYAAFEHKVITWCRVLEDRAEIVVQRDVGRPIAWFRDKKVLVLGCGALGSWAAEILARARSAVVHLVDNSVVKPGLLVRQNYNLEDIGSSKAKALARRLQAISSHVTVEHFAREAHRFVMEDPARFAKYDVVIDCTASMIFQMKLERDWAALEHHSPPVVSVIIDAKARSALAVVVGRNSSGGLWDAFVRMKYRLCLDGNRQGIVDAFYSENATSDLFQPEPGCSDPTFSGSAADTLSLIATVLNLGISRVATGVRALGIAVSAHSEEDGVGTLDVIELPDFADAKVGDYRVRVSSNVYTQAAAWVRHNSRERSPNHETGGLLWGLWDDAVQAIWVLDASGPPRHSLHDPSHFVCGVQGTREEHERRVASSHGVCGFVGMWHTHPDMPSEQSITDTAGMAQVVSTFAQNRKRAIMIIFGRSGGTPTAGIYVYESEGTVGTADVLSVREAQIRLRKRVL